MAEVVAGALASDATGVTSTPVLGETIGIAAGVARVEVVAGVAARRVGVVQLDPDLLAANLHLVGQRVHSGRHRQGLAAADIELSPVPRAGDGMVVELPLRQRPAVVRADIVQAEKLAADLHQDDDPLIDLQQQLAGVRKVGRLGNADEIDHGMV